MSLTSTIRTFACVAALTAGFATSSAQAAFTGSLGFYSISPSINSTSLATATTFTMDLNTNANPGGGFLGTPTSTSFGTASFSLGATSLTFSNFFYGIFTETVAPLITATSVVGGVTTGETFYILGTFTPSAGLGGGGPVAASFTAQFNQTGTSVAASSSLSIPPTVVVPEPASVAMLGLGLAGLGGVALRRRNG